MGNWIGRHLKSDFDKNFENGKYPTTFNYVEYDPVGDQVTVDLSYIAISICLVFLYTPGVNQSGQRRRRDVDIPRTRVAATAATWIYQRRRVAAAAATWIYQRRRVAATAAAATRTFRGASHRRYMAYYTGSFFIASMGMFQIVCSFAGANLLYRYCWPTATGLGYNYFTLFCALSLFIIMGIGADDIFVCGSGVRVAATSRRPK